MKKQTQAQKFLAMLLGTLMLEFVLGVLLTTVIAYNPATPTALQTTLLVLHMLVGTVLFFGAFIHFLNSRGTQGGPTPLVGFLSIIGAFATGGIAAGNGSDVAVLAMALFFGTALIAYGLNYAKIVNKG